jgi:hypothetical protein
MFVFPPLHLRAPLRLLHFSHLPLLHLPLNFNIMKHLVTLVLLLFPSLIQAQTETFDIVTYNSPTGWTKESADFAVSFIKVNNTSRSWCRMSVYKSIAGSGNPSADFASEWTSIVKPESFAGASQPKPTESVIGGWTQNVGQSKFQFDGKSADLLFYTVSGYGRLVTITVSMNSNEFFNEVSQFIGTLNLKAPEVPVAQTTSVNQATTTNTNVAPQSSVIKVTDAPGVHGISVATTNFNDGWTAQPFADYVKVSKQSITVLLHYGVAIDDEMRRADNMAAYFWDHMIAPRYRTSNLRIFQNEPYTYNKIYFMEGDAVELSTGKTYYVALRTLVENGVGRCIEIIAPGAADIKKEFADQDKIAAMVGYNKFIVSASDIGGDWDESTSSSINMYNTVTGSYAGMNMTAAANSFSFGADGNYSSRHVGAFGMVGSTTTYDQKYKGKFTLTNWEVSMTNRFEGKTDEYYCQYEAVRGGRILHLTDKHASGMRYALAKVK